MTASPTATSLAMEFSLDPRVSIVRVEDAGPLSFPGSVFVPAHPPEPLFFTGVNTGAVGSYIYDKDPEGTVQP